MRRVLNSQNLILEEKDVEHCRICGRNFKQLGIHLRRKHNIDIGEYYYYQEKKSKEIKKKSEEDGLQIIAFKQLVVAILRQAAMDLRCSLRGKGDYKEDILDFLYSDWFEVLCSTFNVYSTEKIRKVILESNHIGQRG